MAHKHPLPLDLSDPLAMHSCPLASRDCLGLPSFHTFLPGLTLCPLPGVPSSFKVQFKCHSPCTFLLTEWIASLFPQICIIIPIISIILGHLDFVLFICLPQKHICFFCPYSWNRHKLNRCLWIVQSPELFQWSQRNNSNPVIFPQVLGNSITTHFINFSNICILNYAMGFLTFLLMSALDCVVNSSSNTKTLSAKLHFFSNVPQVEYFKLNNFDYYQYLKPQTLPMHWVCEHVLKGCSRSQADFWCMEKTWVLSSKSLWGERKIHMITHKYPCLIFIIRFKYHLEWSSWLYMVRKDK